MLPAPSPAKHPESGHPTGATRGRGTDFSGPPEFRSPASPDSPLQRPSNRLPAFRHPQPPQSAPQSRRKIASIITRLLSVPSYPEMPCAHGSAKSGQSRPGWPVPLARAVPLSNPAVNKQTLGTKDPKPYRAALLHRLNHGRRLLGWVLAIGTSRMVVDNDSSLARLLFLHRHSFRFPPRPGLVGGQPPTSPSVRGL